VFVLPIDNVTFPHDYRVLFSGPELPVVAGGQAVNLWAITYLEEHQAHALVTKYGSGDMDIVQNHAVIDFIRKLPGWRYEPTSLRNFGDVRIGAARGLTPDGRKLLVEVLHRVHGLEPQDLVAAEVEYAGARFRILDPVAMLKAKAANLREFQQDGNPPRHDAEHLRLVALCMPRFLEDVALSETTNPEELRNQLKTVSRAFAVLQDAKTVATLKGIGIEPRLLVPESLANSPNEKVRKAWAYQSQHLQG
jgi:hypothetical protein